MINWPLLIIIGAQLLFTVSDLLARAHMPEKGFVIGSFISVWFLSYLALKVIAMFGQLYVFTAIELGKSIALFGAMAIILANVLGFLVLQETLSPQAYIGVTLSILAFLVLAVF